MSKIELDGAVLEDQTIEDARLLYCGGDVIAYGCTFNRCEFVFGGAAANTLKFLSIIHQMGGENVVSDIFEMVRSGAYLEDKH